MRDVNGVTGRPDLVEGTPAGTRRELAPDAPRDGARFDPSDTRQARGSKVAGPPRGILRLGHVDVTVTDLDLATAYYTEVLGLEISALTEDSVYLKCWDEEDHHSLRLRYAPQVGLDLMSFKVHHEDDLVDLENKVSRYGLPVERISRGEVLGQGESIRFATPSGQLMELVDHSARRHAVPQCVRNRHQRRLGARRESAAALGWCVVATPPRNHDRGPLRRLVSLGI